MRQHQANATWPITAVLSGILMQFVLGSGQAVARQIELNGHKFTLGDEFTIELVAGPPQVERPIVADFDSQGNLYVADSSGSNDPVEKQLAAKPHRIVRLQPTGDGRFDRSTVFADKMMFPAGAMWRDGSLYVSAPPSIWKLTDTDVDGMADQREEWFAGKTLTGCANDLHGPYAAPDGLIYWCKGAFAEQTYPRPGKGPLVTRAAHIFRAQPNGSQIEPVMTGGMDNPVDVVFTAGGERIFTTTFLQHPAGGRRDGLIHAVYGGVYGKQHDVIERHARTRRELMPVLAHLGPAAPCGLACYQSKNLGDAYQGNLFAALFNLHKITRHVLTPAGATFTSRDEDFLVADDLDFHPTDVIEDADGSLLVIDTGGWYKLCCPTSQLVKPDVLGAIYRIRRVTATQADATSTDPRGIEINWSKQTAAELAALLADPRPAVRARATEQLAGLGASAMPALDTAARHPEAAARTAMVWAATRIDHAGARQLLRQRLTDGDETVRQAAIHSTSVWRDRLAVEPLMQLLQSSSAHNRRAAAEALGRIGESSAVAALLSARTDDMDDVEQVLEHSFTYALLELGDAAATAAGLGSDKPTTRRRALIALDQMPGEQLKPAVVIALLDSPDARLRDTAAWIVSRHLTWGDALAEWLESRLKMPNLTADQRDQLGPLCAKFARVAAIQECLADRLIESTASLETRQLILQAIATAGIKPTPPSWITALTQVLTQRSTSPQNLALVEATIVALRSLPILAQDAPELTGELLEIAAGHDAGSRDVQMPRRIAALAAIPGGLPSVTADQFELLIEQFRAESAAANRSLALDVLSRAKLSDEQRLVLADAVSTAGPLDIERLLAAIAGSSSDAIGLKLVAALRQSAAIGSLRVETLQPRLEAFGPAVQKEADSLYAQLRAAGANQQAKLEELLATLPSGDVRRGQVVFNGKKAVCSACHAVGYLGGNIGPDLTRIGQIRSRRDLLESIVFPSASFVRSYEPVVVTTNDGKTLSGTIRSDTAAELVIATGPNQLVHIARADIEVLQPGTVSVMPAGLGQQLSPQDLADLVAFLQAAK